MFLITLNVHRPRHQLQLADMKRVRLSAGEIVTRAAGASGVPPDLIEQLFRGTPRDFPVIVAETLPLWAHRFGMTGITLFGRVHLRNTVRNLPPAELIALVRHEAEHVRQQRERPVLFYPLYALFWLLFFLNPFPGARLKTLRGKHGRGQGAYRAIPYEGRAYEAGDRALTALRGITQHYSQDFF